ncbi:MAG: hypothetical protein M0003_01495 [Acidithiobacillus sp.]|nr:hypothetical protein [Acidithiobacillus sp.]
MDTQTVQDSTEVALNVLEAIAIAISEPRLNLQRGRWGEAQQYFQCRRKRHNKKDLQ